VKTEYLRWVRRVLQSKLNGDNMIGAINTWAVSLVCYTAGIINWRKMSWKQWIGIQGK